MKETKQSFKFNLSNTAKTKKINNKNISPLISLFSVFSEKIIPRLSSADVRNLGKVSTFFHRVTALEIAREKDMIHHIAHRDYAKANEIIQTVAGYKKEKLKFIRFLHHVAFGQRDEAEVLGNANPTFLSQSGTLTDHAGRTFHNITAFQYALWALDKHMWTMLLNIQDKNKYSGTALSRVEAYNQLKALEEDPKQFSPFGSYYNYTSLTDAYKSFVKILLREPHSVAARYSWIDGIGGAQCNAPAHVAQAFLRLDKNILNEPNYLLHVNLGDDWIIQKALFKEDDLPWAGENAENYWFPLEKNGLGKTYACDAVSIRDPLVRTHIPPFLTCGSTVVYLAFSKLFKERTEQLAKLKCSLSLSENNRAFYSSYF